MTAPAARAQLTAIQRFWQLHLPRFVRALYSALSTPAAIIMLTYSTRVHAQYNMPWWRRMVLACRFCWNHFRVTSGTSWRAHLVMAMRLLEQPPGVAGSVVECGCYKGGATVNLSLACRIVGRKLKVYDSFEGLPPAQEGDYVAEHAFRNGFLKGMYEGELAEVQGNVRRYGALEVCEFHKGWFADTLPHHQGPIALAFLDVDFCASLHDCLLNLWPEVVDKGLVFTDEYRAIPYCAVFYSEKYWHTYFNCDPPGLIGIGTGVQVGNFYTDPTHGMGSRGNVGAPQSVAYTVKGTRALWDYYPEHAVAGEQTAE